MLGTLIVEWDRDLQEAQCLFAGCPIRPNQSISETILDLVEIDWDKSESSIEIEDEKRIVHVWEGNCASENEAEIQKIIYCEFFLNYVQDNLDYLKTSELGTQDGASIESPKGYSDCQFLRFKKFMWWLEGSLDNETWILLVERGEKYTKCAIFLSFSFIAFIAFASHTLLLLYLQIGLIS